MHHIELLKLFQWQRGLLVWLADSLCIRRNGRRAIIMKEWKHGETVSFCRFRVLASTMSCDRSTVIYLEL